MSTKNIGSTYNDIYKIDKYTAPYPDSIQISIPKNIFTAPQYIKDLKLLVSTTKGCCKQIFIEYL